MSGKGQRPQGLLKSVAEELRVVLLRDGYAIEGDWRKAINSMFQGVNSVTVDLGADKEGSRVINMYVLRTSNSTL